MKQTQDKDNWVEPVYKDGRQIQLVPLAPAHLEDLSRNLLVPDVWPYVHWQTRTREDLEREILESLKKRSAGIGNSVAMILKGTSEAVGMSRFMSFNRMHNYLEIGGTWVASRWQKSFVNTEAKLLMLTHAFESLHCQRVEFRVDALNFNSQRGVLRIGAKYEGELRNACRFPDGRRRDYKVYSILDSEWPNIKVTLNWYLDKHVPA